MKKLIIITAIIILGISDYSTANTDYAKRVGGYFYTSLSPHGTWIEIGYGTPVWRPTIIRKNWSPYNYGQWVYTDYGWYWDSYEPFGYIVYHYGRWYYDDYYGWIWIPDYEWAPAWVDWRYDDDYIGWAPLSPYAVFYINIGIHYTYDYYVPYHHWNYVKYNHFCNNNVYNYYVAPKYKYRVHNRTKMRTNYSYYDGRVRNDGIDFDRIRERSGRTIEKRNLVSVNDPNELNRERNSKNRDREIKTYFANPRDISRDGLNDVRIERSDKKSTLELSKLDLGRERTIDRVNDRKMEENRKDEKDRTSEIIRNKNKSEENRNLNRVEDERRIQEKREIEKRNNEQIRRNEEVKRNEQIKRNEEQKRQEQIKRNEQIEIQRKSNEEIKKRNEVMNQRRENNNTNTEVFKKNNERKVEQRNETRVNENKTQVNTNNNRNTEVKRNDSNNRTESRNNSKETEKNNRTRSR